MHQKLTADSPRSVLLLLPVLILTLLFPGCGRSSMPFNGEIQFHDISVVIPKDFIRDSTQSNADLWVFEKGYYTECILITRSDADENVSAQLDSYAERMKELGAESVRGTCLDTDAVLTTYTKEGQYCQEILFPCNGSIYAFALRGGTEQAFQSLLEGLRIPETGNE